MTRRDRRARQAAAVRMEARKLVANLRERNGPGAFSEIEYQLCEDELVRNLQRGPLRDDLGQDHPHAG